MADVFISYARVDSGFVRRLHESLEQADRDIWIDWEDIPPTAEWLKEIFASIAAADNFLFVISPDSCASSMCREELAYAESSHKRLVPVVYRPVPQEALPPALARIQWISFTDGSYDTSFQTLVKAIDTDLDWVQRHTRLLVRAREWEARGHEGSLLLRGKDLMEAESWQMQAATREPKPTALQAQYVHASRQAQTRRQRLALALVTAAMILTGALAIFAWLQRNAARREAAVALSRQLAAQSQQLKDSQLDLASLLGLEAAEASSTFEARDALVMAYESNPRLLTYLDHPSGVNAIATSPDGKFYAVGAGDDLWLWDSGTHRPIAVLKGHTNVITGVAISPDSRLVATGSYDGTVRLWNAQIHEPVGVPMALHHDHINDVAFSPNGKLLATADADNTILLLDVATGRLVGQPLTGHKEFVECVSFSPDGRLLASGGYDRTVRLWNVATQRPEGPPLMGHTGSVETVAFSPDGKTLASSGDDGTIRLWSIIKHAQSGMPITVGSDPVNSVRFSPDGKLLANASDDSTVKLWDVATRRQVGSSLQGHKLFANSVSFSPDGRLLLSGGSDGTVRLWDYASTRPQLSVLTAGSAEIWSIASSPRRDVVAWGNDSGFVWLWDVNARRRVAGPLAAHHGPVTALVFSADGSMLASGGFDKTLRLWDAQTGAALSPPLTGHSDEITGLAFSPDRKLLASAGGNDHTIRLWDLTRHQSYGAPLAEKCSIKGLAFSPDGNWLAWGCGDGEVRLFDFRKRQLAMSMSSGNQPVSGVAFSPNGQILASFEGNLIRLWNPVDGMSIGEALSQPAIVGGIAFSPDGSVLASAGWEDKSIRFWDVATGQPLGGPYLGHTDWIDGIAFSYDGDSLVSGSQDGTVRLWDTNFTRSMTRPCYLANRNLSRAEWQQYFGRNVPYRRTCPSLPDGESISPEHGAGPRHK